MANDNLCQRRHLLFSMLTACAWHDTPAGPAPVVVGLRAFLGAWLGIGRIAVSTARQGYDAGRVPWCETSCASESRG